MPISADLIETLAKIRERIATLETEMQNRDAAATARYRQAEEHQGALGEAINALKIAVNDMVVDDARRDANWSALWKVAGLLIGGSGLGSAVYWFLNWLRTFWHVGAGG